MQTKRPIFGPKSPNMHILGQIWQCLGQIWQCLGQNPNFLEKEHEFWYSHIRKPTRHLVTIDFWSGIAPQWTRKANIWPTMTKNANFWPNWPFLGKISYFFGRKKKFWFPQNGKPPTPLVHIRFLL